MLLTLMLTWPSSNDSQGKIPSCVCVTVFLSNSGDKCTEAKLPRDTSRAIRRKATPAQCRPPETEASASDTNGDLNSRKGNLDELHCSDPASGENSGTDSIITGHCQKGNSISKLPSSIFIHFHKLFLFNGLIYVV